MLRVEYSKLAFLDLEDIWSFGFERWGADQAESYADLLTLRVEWLADNSALWRSREDIGDGVFSYFEGRHIILFESDGEVLYVSRILHQSMEPSHHI